MSTPMSAHMTTCISNSHTHMRTRITRTPRGIHEYTHHSYTHTQTRGTHAHTSITRISHRRTHIIQTRTYTWLHTRVDAHTTVTHTWVHASLAHVLRHTSVHAWLTRMSHTRTYLWLHTRVYTLVHSSTTLSSFPFVMNFWSDLETSDIILHQPLQALSYFLKYTSGSSKNEHHSKGFILRSYCTLGSSYLWVSSRRDFYVNHHPHALK